MTAKSPQIRPQIFLKSVGSGLEPGGVSNCLYKFDGFCLDGERKVLWQGQNLVPLTVKAFDVLFLLVRSGGQLVTKQELITGVWPATFVEESNLTQTVFMLRKALGECPERRYIMTVPGRGYRFAADVKLVAGGGASPPAEAPAGISLLATSPATAESVVRRWPLLAGISLALIVVLGMALLWHRSRPQPPRGRLMLAVLPFENLTGDAAQDYFSDGLTEEMIMQLGSLDPQHVGVIARTSVMHYKRSPAALDQVGRELGVQYVLEGSVRRDSGKVRITAHLVQVKDQTRLWARQYDRELSNLLAVQGEIAQDVAEGIQLTLSDRGLTNAHRAVPKTAEAYQFYLEGRYFWNKRSARDLQQAIEYFQQSVDQDPNYPQAYAGLAQAYALLGGYSVTPQGQFISKARAAAQRALAIDERTPEAHTALAVIAQNYDWNWQVAEREYRRAIELDPNYATAHHWYAEYLALQGRFDEAFVEIERARQLDPLSLIVAADRGVIFYFSRQYDRAIDQFRTVLEMEPTFPRAHMVEFAYVQKGMFADALADTEKWHRLEDGPWIWAILVYVHGRSGETAQTQRALQEFKRLARQRDIDPGPFVLAYLGANDKDKVFVWLEKAYTEHSNSVVALKVDPVYDPLRADPRFQELLRRVGLDQPPAHGKGSVNPR